MLQWFLKDKLHKINITAFFDLVPVLLNKDDVSDLIYWNFIIAFDVVSPNK